MMPQCPPIEHGSPGRFTLPRHDFVPAYRKTFAAGKLRQKVDLAVASLGSCRGCPRACQVNLMDQYRPAWRARTEPRFAAINRPLRGEEFERALEDARRAGLWRLDM